ncbi:D-aminoacyl-tRNA deacylase [Marmoricola sp. Leaf446]|nr:D-aminoacyl-tRNA deacylase [Marmoricola sp. Leaf446]
MSESVYEAVRQTPRSAGSRVETGVFGADVAFALVNDGPVALLLQTPAR